MVRLATAIVAAGVIGALRGPAARPAQAASLTQVTGFGSNPGNLAMCRHLPDGLPAGGPRVVALHGCAQSVPDYFGHSGWRKYADLWWFALVLPQQKSTNNLNSCFNWFATADTGRGQCEALSINQMVDHTIAAAGVDTDR
jgi:feruloyl esterase